MSKYTERQTEIIDFLENLVHRRFSEERLNEVLTMFFQEPIVIENNTQARIDSLDFSCEEDLPTDFNLMFNVDNEQDCGYYDIYMLPMRREGFDGSTIYITEVAYEFE